MYNAAGGLGFFVTLWLGGFWQGWQWNNPSIPFMRVIRQNLLWAFFYDRLGIVPAILGVLNPIMAAVAMLLSSASVVGNTMRLTRDDALAAPGRN